MAEYIERESLLKDIENDSMAVLFDKTSAIHHIKNQPAADVAEVRRGKWIQKEHLVPLARDCEPFDYDCYDYTTHSEKAKYWHCSHCDYEASRHMKPIYKYCPNCGAKMDGGEK